MVLGSRVFSDTGGQAVRVAYSTYGGTLMAVPVHIADSLAAGIVPSGNERTTRLLVDGRFLTTSSDERADIISAALADTKNAAKRSFVLFPGSFCNMGCDYCGQTHFKSQLTRQHRSSVVSRVEHAIFASSISQVDVRWFGAEPLMD